MPKRIVQEAHHRSPDARSVRQRVAALSPLEFVGRRRTDRLGYALVARLLQREIRSQRRSRDFFNRLLTAC